MDPLPLALRWPKRLRVAVQLIKVSDGFPLWSVTYDPTLDDIFAVQDDIAQSVARQLCEALLGRSEETPSHCGTERGRRPSGPGLG